VKLTALLLSALLSLVSANIDGILVLYIAYVAFINTELFVGLNALSSLIFSLRFLLIMSVFGICLCMT
jgi:hypothetical protein